MNVLRRQEIRRFFNYIMLALKFRQFQVFRQLGTELTRQMKGLVVFVIFFFFVIFFNISIIVAESDCAELVLRFLFVVLYLFLQLAVLVISLGEGGVDSGAISYRDHGGSQSRQSASRAAARPRQAWPRW